MKPKPFASLNHFTVPVAMTETFLRGIAPVAPAVMAVSSADIGGQTKTPRELGLARRVAQTSKHATEAAQNYWQYDKSRLHRQLDSCPARRIPTAMVVRREPWTRIPPALGDDVVPFDRVLGASSIKRLFCLEPSSVPQPDDQPAGKALGKRAGRGDRVAHSRGQRQESLVFNPLVGKGLDAYLVVDERNRHGIRPPELGFIGP